MTADGSPPASSRNWRDASSYDYTRNLTREGWALEFLERNPAYAALAAELGRAIPRIRQDSPQLSVVTASDIDLFKPWGLHFRGTLHPSGGP